MCFSLHASSSTHDACSGDNSSVVILYNNKIPTFGPRPNTAPNPNLKPNPKYYSSCCTV